MDSSKIYEQVTKHYSAASQSVSEKYGETVAKSFGYTEEELANIPEGANLGLSCGNPLAITSLREVGSTALVSQTAPLLMHTIERARLSLTSVAALASTSSSLLPASAQPVGRSVSI